MSSTGNEEIRHRILEILFKAEQEKPGGVGVERVRMQEILQTTEAAMNFNMLYLEEKGLVKLLKSIGSLWDYAQITAFGIDVVENKETYSQKFPFIQTTIQEIHGPVYGPAIQAVASQVNFNQQLNAAFQQALVMTDTKEGIDSTLKEEIKKNLNLLEGELKKEEPDAGKIQSLWKWLKRNANWVVPTLSQIVIEVLKRII